MGSSNPPNLCVCRFPQRSEEISSKLVIALNDTGSADLLRSEELASQGQLSLRKGVPPSSHEGDGEENLSQRRRVGD